jgi:hypothetical protein
MGNRTCCSTTPWFERFRLLVSTAVIRATPMGEETGGAEAGGRASI